MGIFSLKKKSKSRRHTRRNISKFNRSGVFSNKLKNKSKKINKNVDVRGLTDLFGKMNVIPHYEPIPKGIRANDIDYYYDHDKTEFFYLDPNDKRDNIDRRRKIYIKDRNDPLYDFNNENNPIYLDKSKFTVGRIDRVIPPQEIANEDGPGELLYRRPWQENQEGYRIIDVESPQRIRTISDRRRMNSRRRTTNSGRNPNSIP